MIEITRQNGDLEKKVWIFWFFQDDLSLVLNEYYEYSRQTKRHKYIHDGTRCYNRISQRHSSLSENEVPVPEDVEKEALQLLISKIRVKKWSEVRR